MHDQELAKFEAYTKQAELDAAELAIKRRMIIAPFDGVVEEIKRKQDEWVNPGDTILHSAAAGHDARRRRGRAKPVRSARDSRLRGDRRSQMARGRKETVRGRITKVSSLVRSDGMYNVRAEVANRQEHGNWISATACRQR